MRKADDHYTELRFLYPWHDLACLLRTIQTSIHAGLMKSVLPSVNGILMHALCSLLILSVTFIPPSPTDFLHFSFSLILTLFAFPSFSPADHQAESWSRLTYMISPQVLEYCKISTGQVCFQSRLLSFAAMVLQHL